jgi:MFS family permease
MRTSLSHVVDHIRTYGRTHTALYSVAVTFFLFRIFDGILSYAVPLLVTEQGYSKTEMGFVVGSSSLAGAAFDILLAKVFKKTSYRKLFLMVFVVASAYIFLLYNAAHLSIFILAMALWGLYFDLMNFGTFNFIATTTKGKEHTSSFGVMSVFVNLGYLLAPIISGMVILDRVGDRTFILALMFLAMGFVCFLTIPKIKPKSSIVVQKKSILSELKSWRSLSTYLTPVLIMTFTLNMTDAFFWTIGPIISESISKIHPFGGLFLTLYYLPALFVGWFVGSITNRYGKKKTAVISIFTGSAVLTTVSLVGLSPILLVIVFVSSLLSAIAWPALNGAYADYIAEAPRHEPEIEGVSDFTYNLAYFVGPIMAGFLSDRVGDINTIALVGLFGMVAALVLFKITPKHIRVPKNVI